MVEWSEMTEKKAFITDLGEEAIQEQSCRFAVWLPENETKKHRLGEVSNSLEELMEKYGVEPEFIFHVAT